MIALALTCISLSHVCTLAHLDELCTLQFELTVQGRPDNFNSTTAAEVLPGPRARPKTNYDGYMPQAAVLTGHVVQRSSFGNTEKGRPWQAWVVATVMLAVLVMLITEARPPDVVMFVALAFVWNLGIITTMEALEGFSNSSLVVVGSMFVVVKAVDRSKLIDRTARATLGDKTSEFGSLCRLCCITLFFGCFINNAPLVALFMPIVRDWARARDFAPSKFLMPLSYASIGGGVLTMIGTSTNLVINGMMQDQTGEAFGFFDPARVGIFQNIFTLCYMLSLGVRLLPESKGGLFRTLKERKQDMVTELQIPQNFPLTGSCVMEVMDALGVPREALLKIFRQPRKGCFTRTISGSGEGELQSHATTLPNLVRMKSSPDIRPLGLSYNERTAHCWGHLQKRRRSMTSGNIPSGGWRPVESHRPRSVTAGDVGASEAEGEGCSRPIDMDDPDVREIFPVADHEVLFGGDVLLLSLPRDACVAFVNSPRVAELLRGFGPDPSQEDGCAAGPKEVGLRICDVDLLDIPGRQNEFVELVISRSNPFVGTDFSGTARHEFEERYQVAVLAVRHRQWEAAEDSKRDHLLSLAHQQNATSLGDSPMGVIEEAPAEPQALQQPASSISSSWLLGASSFRGADPRVAKKLKPGLPRADNCGT